MKISFCVKKHMAIVTRSPNEKIATDGTLHADEESYASSANRT